MPQQQNQDHYCLLRCSNRLLQDHEQKNFCQRCDMSDTRLSWVGLFETPDFIVQSTRELHCSRQYGGCCSQKQSRWLFLFCYKSWWECWSNDGEDNAGGERDSEGEDADKSLSLEDQVIADNNDWAGHSDMDMCSEEATHDGPASERSEHRKELMESFSSCLMSLDGGKETTTAKQHSKLRK